MGTDKDKTAGRSLSMNVGAENDAGHGHRSHDHSPSIQDSTRNSMHFSSSPLFARNLALDLRRHHYPTNQQQRSPRRRSKRISHACTYCAMSI